MNGLHLGPRQNLRALLALAASLAIATGVIAIPAISASASTTPALVTGQIGTASGANTNGQVNLIPTMPHGCTGGDTLIAMVTIEQDNNASSHVGQVSAVPAGWQRLFEHAPRDDSAYQGWFALSNCTSGANSPTFVASSPGNTLGTIAGVVMGEYSGLPSVIRTAFDDNDGATSGTNRALDATNSSPGELVLTALSFDQSSNPSASPVTGGSHDSWQAAGSTTTGMPSFVSWEISGSSQPIADFNWSPSQPFEVTMLGVEAGQTNQSVLQEGQATIAAGSGSVVLPDGITAHNALIAVVDNATGGATTSVSGGGVQWNKVIGATQGSEDSEVWAGFDSSGTSGATSITASLSGSTSGEVTVTEVSGIGGDSLSTSTGTTSGGASSSDPTPSVQYAQGNAFLVAGLAASTALDTHPQPDWSTLPATSAQPLFAGEWLANAPTSSTSANWVLQSPGNWAGVVAVFTPVGAAPSDAPGSTTGISATTATVNGSVSPAGSDTSYLFRYGTGPNPCSSATTAIDVGASGTVPATASLVGLAPDTTYHVQLVAWSAGGTSDTTDSTFTTSFAAPDVTTSPTVSSITATSATLNGSINPNGTDATFVFQFGTSSSYGSSTASSDAGAGSNATAVSTSVSNLTPNTTYHFRLLATGAGGASSGTDQAFTTSAASTPTATTTTTPGATATLPLILAKILTTRLSVGPTHVLVRLRCGRVCHGAIQLFQHRTVTLHRAKQTIVRHESVLLGRSSFSMSTAGAATEKVTLNRTGIRALTLSKAKTFRVFVVVTVNGRATTKPVIS